MLSVLVLWKKVLCDVWCFFPKQCNILLKDLILLGRSLSLSLSHTHIEIQIIFWLNFKLFAMGDQHFIFCLCWQVYYVYGFMLLVFLILIIVTVCVTIVGTYFLLNAENYHWQWTSFFSAASTAVYVYLYSIYYYYVKTKMSGFFQTSFYFGYTLMFCLGLGILCGEFLLFFWFFSFSCYI